LLTLSGTEIRFHPAGKEIDRVTLVAVYPEKKPPSIPELPLPELPANICPAIPFTIELSP
jgi:hypothetical protein